MPRLLTLGLRDDDQPPEQDSQENAASEQTEAPRAWGMLGEFVGDGLGEILFEPRVLLFLAVVSLACIAIFFLVSGAVALAQEVFSGGGPPQTLGLG